MIIAQICGYACAAIFFIIVPVCAFTPTKKDMEKELDADANH